LDDDLTDGIEDDQFELIFLDAELGELAAEEAFVVLGDGDRPGLWSDGLGAQRVVLDSGK
jgi:hypothetical protein